MTRQDAVQSWWDGLSSEEQDEFIRSGDAGEPNAAMQQSMQRAGLVDEGSGGIPDNVLQHLAEKRGGGPDGGKMWH
ncbi:hypothetical protein GA707_08935 [Nostocoides sp. F2B08]|uniref:hypothetical protein n=1 Tax=Nostocoides sp. F2B08 TaxID=2653936 RepID=UPI001263D140|nr:hypothetical protein [Tetrasphaera sp. F2B08]KAB7744702.1 hypothetical protein GA707_08935 [Tetrasphaera sp. F2B08]